MNKLSAIRYILLIAMLLVSQVGSAYASMSVMQGCGMDMSMDAEATDSMLSMQMIDDSFNGNNTKAMDCCDLDITNSSVSTCCDGQCHCSSLVSSIFLSSAKPFSSASYQGENIVIHRITAIHPPFIQLPKRPPIRNFS